jgi:hypothetical protein
MLSKLRALIVTYAVLALISHAQVTFTDVTQTAGTGLGETTTRGISWVDFNNDGFPDLFVPTAGSAANKLYMNNGNGTFTEVATAVGLNDVSNTVTCSWGDFDNDGDMDLIVTITSGATKLWRNNRIPGPDTTFTDISSSAGISLTGGQMPAWADFNRDGYLDVYVPVSSTTTADALYRNNQDATFTNVSDSAGVNHQVSGISEQAITWGDYNKDGYPDLFIGSLTGSSFFHRNNGNGTFTEVAATLGFQGTARGAQWVDYNNDGLWDLCIAGYAGTTTIPIKLFKNNGNGTFTDVATIAGITDGLISWGVTWADYNNDGYEDLFVNAFGQSTTCQLYKNNGDGTFTNVTAQAGLTGLTALSAIWADYDRNGTMDLYTSGTGSTGNYLYRNNGDSTKKWLEINLAGTTNNRKGIGAQIEVYAGTLRMMREVNTGVGYRSQNMLTAHFGLGENTVADSVIVRWPNGALTKRTNVVANQVITITEQQSSGLTGTKTIPGDYATLAVAIAALNANGVGSGGVTFTVAAGYTETAANLLIDIVNNPPTSANPITFRKNGTGANPLITADAGISASLDGIIKLAGTDYITFDGIDLLDPPSNTGDAMMEWGYALLKKNSTAPVDGCRHVTIKNCVITLNRNNTLSSGIYSGNHTAASGSTLTLADSLDVMAYCKFFNNTISNVYYGLRIAGSTNVSFYDVNNEIGVDGQNTISNIGGGSASAYGMNIEYQNNLKIANNAVSGGNASHTGALYGIRTGSGTNASVDIYNNTVTLNQGTTSTNLIYGIANSMGSSGTSNTVNIYNNTVENCSHTASTTNSVWLIYNIASCFNLNIYGNIVRNNIKGAGTGPMYCIYNSPTSPTTNARIYGNQLYNNSSAGTMYGVYITAGTNTWIYKNRMYDLRSASTATSFVTGGITVTSGPVNTSIYNNFISDLQAALSAAVDAVRAVNITSTTASSTIGVYYNSIFLNATSSGTNFGTTGVYHTASATATTATLDMRNNIVVNLSTPNGTGKTAAYRRSSTSLGNFSTLSNNNCLYAGTPGVNNVLFYDGTNFDQTLAAYQARMAPRESASLSVLPPFVNIATAPFDLHMNPEVASPIDSGATPVAGITDDYDGDTRDLNLPDIGADEYARNPMGVEDPKPTIPTRFALAQNYPNPFNPSTIIRYDVPVASHVEITVYDVLGRKVATLVDGDIAAGSHELRFSAEGIPSGVYFCWLSTKEFSSTIKMLVMK